VRAVPTARITVVGRALLLSLIAPAIGGQVLQLQFRKKMPQRAPGKPVALCDCRYHQSSVGTARITVIASDHWDKLTTTS
jgi:hypothetical protein